ncbi:MAG: pyridoxamine 5'-phosphate oxidase [Cyclobacteriaceae bacterium]
MKGLADIRTDYTKATLDSTSVEKDPLVQFEKWFQQAIDAKVLEPNAMSLATIAEGGRPSSRIVLLKGIEKGQFLFYTNYQSQKGKELELNPACALNFFWPELERQVRIEGVAGRVSPESSEEYFQSRPRASQVGAWASPQSSLIADRDILESRAKQIEEKYKGFEVLPRPKQWGGFGVAPLEIEFWQGRPSRLHDRIVYSFSDNKWKVNRLAP